MACKYDIKYYSGNAAAKVQPSHQGNLNQFHLLFPNTKGHWHNEMPLLFSYFLQRSRERFGPLAAASACSVPAIRKQKRIKKIYLFTDLTGI